LTYTKTFDKHKITGVAGMSRSTRNNEETMMATRNNVPAQSNYWNLDFSTDLLATNPQAVVQNNHSTPIVSLAYFARAEYEFDNKYLLSASFRREGTSNFLAAKRWANFASLSAGWVVSNERFFEKIKFVNYFKIRGGYGQVGNAIGTPSVNTTLFSNNYNYSFGTANNQGYSTINSGYNIPYQVDPNLTWESMNEIDLGFDFRFIANKLSATVDLYNRKTKDIILPVKYPDVVSPGEVYTNAGDVINKGVEISLKWEDKINNNLRYSVGGNFSYNKNELTNIYNPYFKNLTGGSTNNGEWTKEFHEGDPLGSFYVYDVLGYNADGGFIYSDKRVNAGSYIPKYTYGINLSVNYKNFDLSTDLYGVGGNKIYNGKKAQRLNALNVESAVLDNFWSPSNTNAANPKPSNEKPKASTYYVEDGAYLRINNITIGYTLPKINPLGAII
jgi:outer membrane receptor protein involved in Fe transport